MDRTPPEPRPSARWPRPSGAPPRQCPGAGRESSDGSARGTAGTCRVAVVAAMLKSAGGLPIRMAMACSSCARSTSASNACARVDMSCALGLRDVARAATPTAYWFRVSCSDRSYLARALLQQADLRVLHAQQEVILRDLRLIDERRPPPGRRRWPRASPSSLSTPRRIRPQRSISQPALTPTFSLVRRHSP
jgi:hypothetical protein